MNLEKLNAILKNEPKFRSRQAYRAIFVNLIDDWDEDTTLPKALREKLQAECPLGIEAQVVESGDQRAVKAAVFFDGEPAETVLMKHSDGRHTVCLSSQLGCALNCAFCLTGRKPGRSLKYHEIITQALFFARYLKKSGERLTNAVFMGMGEPFLNYDNVIRAAKTLHDPELFNLGARRISISTVGIIDGIERLAREPFDFNLAVSVHAPNDKLRGELMPINDDQPLAALLDTVKKYIEKTDRRVMIEYVLLDGVNDRTEQARELAELLKKGLEKLFFVNLISYNPTEEFKASPPAVRKRFREALEAEGIVVVERYRFGRDIKAACGQLAGRL